MIAATESILKNSVCLWATVTYWAIPNLMWIVFLVFYSTILSDWNLEPIKQYPVTSPVPLRCIQRCNIHDIAETVLSREVGCWHSKIQRAKLWSLWEFCPFFKKNWVSYGVANAFTCLVCVMNLEHIIYRSYLCVLYFTCSQALHVWHSGLVWWHFLTMHNQFCKWSGFSLARWKIQHISLCLKT